MNVCWKRKNLKVNARAYKSLFVGYFMKFLTWVFGIRNAILQNMPFQQSVYRVYYIILQIYDTFYWRLPAVMKREDSDEWNSNGHCRRKFW